MPLASWLDYDTILDGIAGGSWRVIGWGAGEAFSSIYTRIPLRLDYLVDANPAKWGSHHHGLPVREPAAIADENPARTVVVIYPYRAHGGAILSALDVMGPYQALPPFDPLTMRAIAGHLRWMQGQGGEAAAFAKPPARSENAILVQGPLIPGMTETALEFYARRYPDDWLILSTWDTSPPDLVERLAPWADRVLLNPPPATGGAQNRNFQIVSTRAAVAEAARLGLDKALKTRTDTLVAGEAVLERGTALQKAVGNGPCQAWGAKNRIVALDRYTMRYMPYMVSDIAMFGDVADLDRYWSAPEDTRTFDPYALDWMTRSYCDVSRERALAEIYLASHYLDTLGWPLLHTVADHWRALADLFVVVDEGWFGHFFPRYDLLPLTVGADTVAANTVVDHAFWQRLHLGISTGINPAGIDLDTTLYRHMWQGAPVGQRTTVR